MARALRAQIADRRHAAPLAGIGVATYIAIAESGGGAPKCLAGGGGCEAVSESRYLGLAGINVAVLGIAGYALALSLAVAATRAFAYTGRELGIPQIQSSHGR